MPGITRGLAATNRASSKAAGNTHINYGDGDEGKITSLEVWFNSNATGVYVGTAWYDSGNVWNVSGVSVSLGSVTAGSKQTFSGLNFSVSASHQLAIFFASGNIEADSGYAGARSVTAQNEVGGSQQYQFDADDYGMSLHGIGVATPSVTTQSASSVASTTATGNGNVTDTGGSITERGICYKTSTGPTTADSTSHDHTDAAGAFTMPLTGLSPSTVYHCKAYCINAMGTSYGAEQDFTTTLDAPTNVSVTENQAAKVVVTWTKSAGATGYRVYRDNADVSGLLGDVASYDDTTSAAPVITPGSTVSSDGTNCNYVSLSLSGASIANGTTHTYKVVAVGNNGNSADSGTDTGYRLAAALTYQYQRSAADSNASYSDISGGTTAAYNDPYVPEGSGRYYRCRLNSSGASEQISAVDRGYRLSLIGRNNIMMF
jgi:hypothetical protein